MIKIDRIKIHPFVWAVMISAIGLTHDNGNPAIGKEAAV